MQIQCPKCNYSRECPEEYRGQKGKCPRCGDTFILPSTPINTKPSMPVTVSPTPPKPTATKPCPFCAEEIHAEATKCRHCGEFLNIPSQQSIKPPTDWPNVPLLEKRRTMFAWSFIAGMVVAGMLILFVAYVRAGYEVPGFVALLLVVVGCAWTLTFLIASINLTATTYESEVARIGMTVLLFIPVANVFVPYITYFAAVSLIKKHKP